MAASVATMKTMFVYRPATESSGFQVWGLGLVGSLLLVTQAVASEREFGFTGPEIFPVERNISLMQAADLDGDGLTDLVVANNDRSRITLLINRSGHLPVVTEASASPQRELNDLPPDARFRLEPIASEKRISTMVVADFNADGLPDIAHFGEPKDLTLLLNSRTNAWRESRKWPIADGQPGANALAHGDLNGDRLNDLILVGETAIYCLFQKPDHTMTEPEKLPLSDMVRAVQILDIDGDSRQDLLLVNWESPNPLRFRLQDAQGRLGPEIHFSLSPVRSFWADDLDKDGQTEMVCITQNSGRAQLSKFIRRPAQSLFNSLEQGQFQVRPFAKTAKSRRGIAWTDLNGDHRPDLVASEPDSGQLMVFLQKSDGQLQNPSMYPCLTGISEISIADWDGDGVMDIFVLSLDERQIGLTRWTDQGRLSFPGIVNLEGRPLAMTVGPLKSGTPPILAVILDRDGKRVLHLRSAKAEIRTQYLSSEFKSNPNELLWHDVDQDGWMDLVVLIQYEKVKILRQVPDKEFEEIDLAPPGGNSEQPWTTRCDVDGDGKAELMLAQKNFLRAVVLEPNAAGAGTNSGTHWTFLVKEQINGASSQSRIAGATALEGTRHRDTILVLLDAEQKALTLCGRDGSGVWKAMRNLPLPVTDFGRVEAVALGGSTNNAVALFGLNGVATQEFSGSTWELTELGSYETPIKDGFLLDVVSGDLDQDGLQDLVFLETLKHHVDLVRFVPPRELVGAVRWQVFEDRSYRGQPGQMAEPRESLVADLTGDGRNDLVVLVHDRILLYPQE